MFSSGLTVKRTRPNRAVFWTSSNAQASASDVRDTSTTQRFTTPTRRTASRPRTVLSPPGGTTRCDSRIDSVVLRRVAGWSGVRTATRAIPLTDGRVRSSPA